MTYKNKGGTYNRGEDGKWHPPMEPDEPIKPERSHYDLVGVAFAEREVIYHDVEVLGDSDIDLEECFADQDKQLPHPTKGIQNLSLQDVVDLAPPGAKLSDIVFNIEYPRYLEYMEFTFSHVKRDLQEEERVFQVAMEKYQEEYTQYQKDIETYQKELVEHEGWEKNQKIKKLEAQLAQLKK